MDTAAQDLRADPALWRPQTTPPNRSLYFSLYPDPAVALEAHGVAYELRARHRLTGRPTPPERLHISLNGLGPFSQVCILTVERALAAARAVKLGPFRIGLDRAESWGRGSGRRPLVLTGDEGLEGVMMLHGQIHAALAEAGLVGRRERPFAPHMTLLRDLRSAPETRITPLVWTTGGFALVYSLKDEGRHEVLGHFPLSR